MESRSAPTSVGSREASLGHSDADQAARTWPDHGESGSGMGSPTSISDAAGVATAVGVLFGAAQLLLGRSQTRTNFEDDLSNQYRQMIKPRLVEGLLQPLSDDERHAVTPYYEYFDLCNEQVFLRIQGRVSAHTWAEWAKGIGSNLERGSIKTAWEIVLDQHDAFGDFEELRLLHTVGFEEDPRDWNPWRRRSSAASELRATRVCKRA